MAKNRDKREKRKARSARVSTNRRLSERDKGFESTTVELPKDVGRVSIKDAKSITGDILNYPVGKGNRYADEGMLHWERTFYVHHNIGPDMKSYVCPAMESGGRWNWPGYATGGKKKCPVCKEVMRLHNEGDEDDKNLIQSIKLKERQLVNWRDVEDESGAVKVWDFANWPLGDLIDTELRDDPDEEYQDFSDWENGLSLRITFEEAKAGKGRTYFKPKTIKFRKRKEQYDPDEIEQKVHCLDNFIKVLEPEELKRIFLQTADDESDGSSDKKKKTKFKESDVQKIKEMSEKQLKKFVVMNDLDIDLDEGYDTVEELRDLVLEEVKEAIAEGKSSKKADKKTEKKADKKKKDPEPEPDDEDDDEDDEDEDEDEDESEDEDEEDEEESEDEDSDDAEEDEEDSDDDEEDEDSEDDDSDDDEEDEDEDEEDEDEDEEDEEDEDEDEKPAPKRGRGRPRKS